jgi:hypothetical protein
MKSKLLLTFLIFFYGIFILNCQSSRPTNSEVNPANNTTANTKPQTSSAGGAAGSENTFPNSVKPEDANQNKNPVKASPDADSKDKVENRCGWFENPTPANMSLIDKDGEWIISTQGGSEAEGMDNIPDFPDDKWVKTNVNYGYGCACLRVSVDRKEERILKIVSGTAKPNSVCRNDKTLGEP